MSGKPKHLKIIRGPISRVLSLYILAHI